MQTSLLVGLVLLVLVACQSPPSDSSDDPADAEAAVVGPRQAPGPEPAESEPGIRFPEDPVWQEAHPVSGEVRAPKKISGPALDLYGQIEDRRYSLGVCVLGLVIDAEGTVERSYFLAPQRAGEETRDLLLETVRSWQFEPATKEGVPLRVRYILSITDYPYLPANGA
jgi:uncharacterized protein YfaP (DUF2135 family)